jgi:hypothetical protein
VNVEPLPIRPTWYNGRSGSDGVAKGLDKFLVSKHLIESNENYWSWIVLDGMAQEILDHTPIFLPLGSKKMKFHSIFKFSHLWVKEE